MEGTIREALGHLRSHVLGVRATAQTLEGGDILDLHGLFLTGLSSLQMCLDQFLHFRWAITRKKGHVDG